MIWQLKRYDAYETQEKDRICLVRYPKHEIVDITSWEIVVWP